jgi:tetratricopeptide (TPR) repeat protein/DNA-binding CsgD family transcriptional regulator
MNRMRFFWHITKNNKAVCLVFLMLSFGSLYGQKQSLEQLLSSIEKEHGPDRAMLYATAGWRYNREGNVSLATLYADSCMSFSEEHSLDHGKANALALLADLDFHSGQYDDAMEKCLLALRFDLSNSPRERSYVNVVFAKLLDKIGAQQLALAYLRGNYLLWQADDSKEHRFFSTSAMAIEFLSLAENDSAIHYFQEALAYVEYQNRGASLILAYEDERAVIHAFNNLGVAYSRVNQLDSAMVYHLLALEEARMKPNKSGEDSLLMGFIVGNIGTLYGQSGRLDTAITLLTQDYLICQQYGSKTEFLNTARDLISLLMDSKQYDSALAVLDSVYPLSTENGLEQNQIELLALYSKLNNLQGNADKALNYAYEYLNRLQELHEKSDRLKSKALEELAIYKIDQIKTELEVQKLELEKSGQENRNARVRLYIIIGGALLLIVIIVLLYSRKIGDQRKKAELIKINNQLIKAELKGKELELNHKSKELEQFALRIIEKNKFLEDIQTSLKTNDQRVDAQKIRTISTEINHNLHLDLSRKEFEMRLDEVHQLFFHKLDHAFPQLTKSERRLCSLLVLDLSTKGISSVLNISISAVNKNRQRLRKKLDIISDQDLGEFLRAL